MTKPEQLKDYNLSDTKIGLSMMCQFARRYKIDIEDAKFAKSIAKQLSDARTFQDIQ